MFNGLLLAPHLDAAFDAGFFTIAGDGTVSVSGALPVRAKAIVGLEKTLKMDGLCVTHEHYLLWHRSRVFQADYSEPAQNG